MQAIRQQLKNPVVLAATAFVIGLLFGLIVLGWWLWPVKYTGATAKDLVYESKVEYMRMAVEAFGQNHLVDKAKERFAAVGKDADKILAEIAQEPGDLAPEMIQGFKIAAGATGATIEPTPGKAESKPGAKPTPTKKPSGGTSGITIFLVVLCLVVLAAAAVAVYLILRSRGPKPGGAPGGAPSGPVTYGGEEGVPGTSAWTAVEAPGGEPPLMSFMAQYKLGDDLFDDSFSIDSQAGEFLGECGVGISEPIGVGEPKKVTAFEVWLFDKNDIQTVTKVLMSTHAFNDETIHQKLAAKGEPVLVAPGEQVNLETQTLRLQARVVDMGYGNGSMPAESYFDRFVLELIVWQKRA